MRVLDYLTQLEIALQITTVQEEVPRQHLHLLLEDFVRQEISVQRVHHTLRNVLLVLFVTVLDLAHLLIRVQPDITVKYLLYQVRPRILIQMEVRCVGQVTTVLLGHHHLFHAQLGHLVLLH